MKMHREQETDKYSGIFEMDTLIQMEIKEKIKLLETMLWNLIKGINTPGQFSL